MTDCGCCEAEVIKQLVNIPKASRWLPPSRTSSLVTLDLPGLGACVGSGEMGLCTPPHTLADPQQLSVTPLFL